MLTARKTAFVDFFNCICQLQTFWNAVAMDQDEVNSNSVW